MGLDVLAGDRLSESNAQSWALWPRWLHTGPGAGTDALSGQCGARCYGLLHEKQGCLALVASAESHIMAMSSGSVAGRPSQGMASCKYEPELGVILKPSIRQESLAHPSDEGLVFEELSG